MNNQDTVIKMGSVLRSKFNLKLSFSHYIDWTSKYLDMILTKPDNNKKITSFNLVIRSPRKLLQTVCVSDFLIGMPPHPKSEI